MASAILLVLLFQIYILWSMTFFIFLHFALTASRSLHYDKCAQSPYSWLLLLVAGFVSHFLIQAFLNCLCLSEFPRCWVLVISVLADSSSSAFSMPFTCWNLVGVCHGWIPWSPVATSLLAWYTTGQLRSLADPPSLCNFSSFFTLLLAEPLMVFGFSAGITLSFNLDCSPGICAWFFTDCCKHCVPWVILVYLSLQVVSIFPRDKCVCFSSLSSEMA